MSPTSIDSPPPLDRRARALLAAYREHEPPPGVRERGWARLEDAGHDDAIEPAPTPARATRVLTLALGVAAAYVLIVWIVAAVDRELVSPRAPDAAVQAQDGEGAGAETRAASAGTRAPAVDGAPSSAATPPPPPSPVDVSDAPAPSAPGRSGSARSERTERSGTREAASRVAAAPSSGSARASGPQLALEQEVLERGWTALREGQAARALEEAESHARRFPAGALAPEREALGVAARCQLSPATGRAQLAAFARAHPRSPALARVRVACQSPARAP